MSSSHVAMFDAIGQIRRVCGVSGIDYISNAYVNEHRCCGEVLDVGYDTNLNFERLAAMQPDLMPAVRRHGRKHRRHGQTPRYWAYPIYM